MTLSEKIRLSHFLDRKSRRGIIVPIDHGLSIGPVEGLESLDKIGGWITHPAITGVIAHKGMIARLASRGLLQGAGVMIHLNGMTSLAPEPNRKERMTSVEAAMRLGADAVSLQINFDGSNDAHNLTQLGATIDEAQAFGLPVLTMLYDKVPSEGRAGRLRRLRHLVRACVELGTSALKLAAPVDPSELPVLLDGVKEHTHIFFAGGEVRSESELLQQARVITNAGAAGLCVGRNIFQRDAVETTLNRLSEVVFGGGEEAAR